MAQQPFPLLDAPMTLDDRHALISSRRVEGTPVCNRANQKLGTIHSVMIDKVSGQVAYAVLSFGGFLGLGEHVQAVPWGALRYDPVLDVYMADATREQIESAPSMRLDIADRPQPEDYVQTTGYYAKLPWWGL